MRRRFGRRRKSEREAAVDPAHWLGRIREAGVIAARSLEPVEHGQVPPSFAVVGAGESEDGAPLVVAFAPRSGGDALLGGLAIAAERSAAGTFEGGQLVAIAPGWSSASRRRLGVVAPGGFPCRAIAAPALGESGDGVEPEPPEEPLALGIGQVAAQLPSPDDAELFLRAASGLAGLAAKHGGALRGLGRSVELVLHARRVASLRVDEGGMVLETVLPRRASERVDARALAEILDRLEGQLRKRAGDRQVREGEEGFRAEAIAPVAAGADLRAVVRWPLGGGDVDVLDFLALDAEGHPVAGAVRERLGLEALGPILDAVLCARAALPVVFAGAAPPVCIEVPRLLLAARELDDPVAHVIGALTLEVTRADLAGADVAYSKLASGAPPAQSGRRGSRRGRGRGRGRRGSERAARGSDGSGEGPRFEEVTLFDLDDDRPPSRSDEPRGRRSRRRGRRPARREQEGGAKEEAERAPVDSTPEESVASAADEPAGSRESFEIDDEQVAEDGVALVDADVDLELEARSQEAPELEEEEVEEAEREEGAQREERLRRTRARIAEAEPEPEEPAKPALPRRAVIVAHADRDSLAAAVLLARDVRMVDGLWVYPQSELMTFFRSVATDLREERAIYVVGFTASPARETLQAAALYRGRIVWLDHHDWPPEDLGGLGDAIGTDAVHIQPDLDSSLPLVLAQCTRRSRFSDKLVDLVTGRFTEHDFGRWGALWWWRLGEFANRPGDRRSDIGALLAGRPSDLAREASRAEAPPLPPEFGFVSEHDFRLIHFGGFGLTLVPTPPDLSPGLAARIARERYGAQLSLAWTEGGNVALIGADDLPGRHSLDPLAMAQHLADKLEWVDALPAHDYVARIQIKDLSSQPDRIDAVVNEIAMGRSVLEG